MMALCECGCDPPVPYGFCHCRCGLPAPLSKRTWRKRGRVKGQPIRFINGHNKGVQKELALRHGAYRTPEYRAYVHARARCINATDPHWKDYGGRGIKFLFDSFEAFIAELGPRPSPQHSIDRTNNDGHYAPGNCRWATVRQQVQNKRKVCCLAKFTKEELLAEIERRSDL